MSFANNDNICKASLINLYAFNVEIILWLYILASLHIYILQAIVLKYFHSFHE